MGLFDSFHSSSFSTHQDQCGSCAKSVVSQTSLTCYCEKYRDTYKLDDEACKYYEYDKSKNYNFWRKIYTYYILTAISDILNIDKYGDLYQNFMTLIQLVRSDETICKEACMYNVYGPILANCLYNDPNKVEICKDLLTNYLSKAFVAIADNRLDDAINIYKSMVEFLYVRYASKENFENIIDVDVVAKPKVLVK